MSPAKVALKSLRRHHAAFYRHYRVACQKGTVRSVHQLRTNARRFRNALRTYSVLFDKDTVENLNRLFQRAAREASALRDLDVYLLFLNQYRGRLRSEVQRHCIREMIMEFRDCRTRKQSAVSKSLQRYSTRLGPSRVIGVLERKVKKTDGSIQYLLMDIFHDRVERSVNHLLAYNSIVPYPEKKAQLHEMRKCAKHLRYTLEGVRPYFDSRLQLHTSRVLFFHKLLGEIHDYDVWMDMLDECRAGYKLNTDMGRSLNVLNNYLRNIRSSRYRAFVRRWHGALNNRHFEDMLEFVYAHH